MYRKIEEMNNELKQQLTQFLEKALNIAEQGVDEIPFILQDIVNWQIMNGVTCLILFILSLVALGISIYFAVQGDKYDRSFSFIIGMIGTLVFSLLCIVCIIESTILVKALVAPRLVIIDYLKGLL